MDADEKILLVDDEPRILEALQRALRNEFHIETAQGPEEGLEAVVQRGPFAVVVSDLKMPGMDGIQFLARVKACSPDSSRVMLTGHADLETAIAAVNEGSILRFLTKPCPAMVLSRTLTAAVDQYRLVTSERQLLERTLTGTVTVLTDVLSVVYPAAFSRSSRIKRYVTLLAHALGIADAWQFEVAAILSQIGCITLPPATADRLYAGAALSEDEVRLVARHPSAGAAFLRKIPRMESTAQIIAWQQKPFREYQVEPEGVAGQLVTRGAQILHVAIDLERLMGRGAAFRGALAEMRARSGEYNPALLRAIEEAGEPVVEWRQEVVPAENLDTSMIANEDVRARNGLLLLTKGEQITYPALERLRSFATEIGIVEPVRVLLPGEV